VLIREGIWLGDRHNQIGLAYYSGVHIALAVALVMKPPCLPSNISLLQRVGLRLSPWSTFQGMGLDNPIPQFTDVINKARKSAIAYLHLVESRICGSEDYNGQNKLDFAYNIWDGPLLVAGGYTSQEAQRLVDEKYPNKNIIVIFGRYFISNPDLVYRIKEGLKLSAYDRDTFYNYKSALGYSDYPFSKEYILSEQEGDANQPLLL
jgi:NADPH2 dehydrogenase